MRTLTIEEMAMVSGGGGSLDAQDGPSRNTDFGPSRGPQTRGGRRNDGRNAAMDSYLGKDVYGANAVGLSPDFALGVGGALVSGISGGIKGMAYGALGGVIGAIRGGVTTPSPSNRGGGSSGRGGVSDGRGDGGGRGGGQ